MRYSVIRILLISISKNLLLILVVVLFLVYCIAAQLIGKPKNYVPRDLTGLPRKVEVKQVRELKIFQGIKFLVKCQENL